MELELYLCDVSVRKAHAERKSQAKPLNIVLPRIIQKESESEEELLPRVQAGDSDAMIELGERSARGYKSRTNLPKEMCGAERPRGNL